MSLNFINGCGYRITSRLPQLAETRPMERAAVELTLDDYRGSDQMFHISPPGKWASIKATVPGGMIYHGLSGDDSGNQHAGAVSTCGLVVNDDVYARWISARIALEIRLRYMYKWRDMAGENVLNLAPKIAPHSSIFACLHAVPPYRGPDLGVAAQTPLASVGDKTSPRSRPLRPRPALPIAVGARRAREVDDERHGAQDGGAVHPPWRADDAFSRCEPHTCCIAIGGDAKSDTLPAATATLVAAALKWERKTKETKNAKKKKGNIRVKQRLQKRSFFPYTPLPCVNTAHIVRT
ncbi:hypothetical protein B0H13DRAFT_2277369 [Mycena leptocephala]|nr:hypothetical protein B0H13DRAFT_2277369 [Mycena leptocephala]